MLDVPNSKVASAETSIVLKLMLSSPLKLLVDSAQPDEINNPHPPALAHVFAVGAIPPNHVPVAVKLPDTAAINVTRLNV